MSVLSNNIDGADYKQYNSIWLLYKIPVVIFNYCISYMSEKVYFNRIKIQYSVCVILIKLLKNLQLFSVCEGKKFQVLF